MNENRPIVIFSPTLYQKNSEPIFTIFTRCRGISIAINPCIYKTKLHFFGNAIAKSEDGQFWRLQKGPKVNQLQTSLQLLQNLFQFYNLHTWAYQCWKVGEGQSNICWDIWYDMSIFAVSSQKVNKLPAWSLGLVDRSLPKIVQNVAKIVPFIISKSDLRYSNPLRNLAIIGCHSNVPKGIEKSPWSRKFTQIPFIWWKNRENWSSRSRDSFARVKKI